MVIPPDACYERCGLDEKARARTVMSCLKDAFFAGRGTRRPAWRTALSQFMADCVWRTKYLSSLGVDGSNLGDAAVAEYIGAISEFRPRQLSGLPYYLFILAIRHRSAPKQLQVDVLRPSGGKATAHMIDIIEKRFGGRYRENYGTAELGTVAFDCSYSRVQHLLDDLFTIEFLRNGITVAAGELGELIITDLRNRASPLIRYEVGDIGVLREENCECGRSATRFEVKGRVDETIVLPDGRAFAGDDVIDHFQRQAGLSFCKLVQNDTSHFLLEVAPSGGDEIELNDSRLSEGFRKFLDFDVTVASRRVRRIAPEPSGKYRLVISTTFMRFHDLVVNPQGRALNVA